MNQYLQGSLVTVSAAFIDDVTRTPVDPSSITLKIGTGPMAETVYTYGSGNVIVRDATGVYHAEIDTTSFVAGIWYYQWDGTGNCQAIDAEQFQILLAPL
jgi:hypothetical protein